MWLSYVIVHDFIFNNIWFFAYLRLSYDYIFFILPMWWILLLLLFMNNILQHINCTIQCQSKPIFVNNYDVNLKLLKV
jgi:TRAP-type C4-dicarboxylate transport system permease small subunit